jgi:hypothetical protein
MVFTVHNPIKAIVYWAFEWRGKLILPGVGNMMELLLL